ncbi:MAG: hypothetical protein VYC50_05840 [Pseudomonadota bacterium]|mgnify:FL=1|nr:hypothetical protein [Gammaproteobacteria bacterium]MEE2684609.1 hypothetical protein [Pseudomonadota bacterium]
MFYKKSILRYFLASLGGVAITITLFLFMHDGVTRFLLKDPIRYFTISNFIPAPDRGRQLPDAPLPVQIAPEKTIIDFDQYGEIDIEREEIIIEDIEQLSPSAQFE